MSNVGLIGSVWSSSFNRRLQMLESASGGVMGFDCVLSETVMVDSAVEGEQSDLFSVAASSFIRSDGQMRPWM